jgi:WD40 repeat protein
VNPRASSLIALLLLAVFSGSSALAANPTAPNLKTLLKSVEVAFSLTQPLGTLEYDPLGRELLSIDVIGMTLWDAQTGVVRWRVSLPDDPQATDVPTAYYSLRSVTLPDTDTVRLTYESGAVLVLQRSTGKILRQEKFQLPAKVLNLLQKQAKSPDEILFRNMGQPTRITYSLLESKHLLAYTVTKKADEVNAHEVIVYDLEHGKDLYHIREPIYGISVVSFSPDGKWMALEGQNRISIWEMSSGLKQFNLRENIYSRSSDDGISKLEWSSDSKTLASLGSEFNLWDVTTGKRLKHLEFELTDLLRPAAWNGHELALIGSEGFISFRSPNDGKERLKLGYALEQTYFSPSGKQFVTRSSDGRLRLYAVDTLDKPRDLPLPEGVQAKSVGWLESKKQLLVLTDQNFLQLDFSHSAIKTQPMSLDKNWSSSYFDFTLSTLEDKVVLKDNGSYQELAQIKSTTLQTQYAVRPYQECRSHSLDFTVVICSVEGGKLEAYSWDSETPLWTRSLNLSPGESGWGGYYPDFSPSGKRIAFPWREHQILILDSQSGKTLVSIPISPLRKDQTSLDIRQIIFSHDERWIALETGDGWRFFDLSSKKEMPAPLALSSAKDLFFTGDGRYLVAQSLDTLEFYRLP